MANHSSNEAPTVAVDALFVGSVGTLANDGAASAIDKQPVTDARWLDDNGVAGDAQADRKHHGGRDRALNHYPAEHYRNWHARYPGYEDIFVAGVLGENVSTRGITEHDVHVGDVFTLGEATIQITQPRQPCWKIGTRVGIAGLAKALVVEGRAGWLYRVIEPGHIRTGDVLRRAEQAEHGITLAQMWSIVTAHQPSDTERAQMRVLAELGTLAPDWRKRMSQRARAGR